MNTGKHTGAGSIKPQVLAGKAGHAVVLVGHEERGETARFHAQAAEHATAQVDSSRDDLVVGRVEFGCGNHGFLARVVPSNRSGGPGEVEHFSEAPLFGCVGVGRDVVETVQFSHHFGHFDRCEFSNFKFHTKACVFAICVVEDVHTKFGRHVEAIVWTNVHAHLTRSAGFPNHADSAVVIPGDEEPRLHVFEALVGVLNRLGFPKRGFEVRGHTVGGEFLTGNVVHHGRGGCASAAPIIEELWVGGVVVSTEPLAEPLADEREGSKRRDQRNLERIPEQVSEIGLCVWMHWHGITSLLPRGNRPRRLVRMDVEHSFLID